RSPSPGSPWFATLVDPRSRPETRSARPESALRRHARAAGLRRRRSASRPSVSSQAPVRRWCFGVRLPALVTQHVQFFGLRPLAEGVGTLAAAVALVWGVVQKAVLGAAELLPVVVQAVDTVRTSNLVDEAALHVLAGLLNASDQLGD